MKQGLLRSGRHVHLVLQILVFVAILGGLDAAAWRRGFLCTLTVLAVATSVAAQSPSSLRVTHTIDKTGPTSTEISGYVYNDGSIDVIDVYVNAAAIDQSGKVLAQGIPYVGMIPARGNAPFKARVPTVPGATGFRVGINSVRFAMTQS
jgi:hypothetical protein